MELIHTDKKEKSGGENENRFHRPIFCKLFYNLTGVEHNASCIIGYFCSLIFLETVIS